VQPFVPQLISLYASDEYVERHGKPASFDDLAKHSFVATDNLESRAPFMRWLLEKVDEKQIAFRATDARAIRDAVVAGAGIGFISCWEAERFPNLVQLFEPQDSWKAPLWLVTHVDLHRTTKVQAFLKFLKDDAKNW